MNMKLLVLPVIVLCLFLLFRMTLARQPEVKRGGETPRKKESDSSGVVVKNRFVLPSGQPLPTPATSLKTDSREENALIFACGNENRNAVIPSDELGEVFGEDVPPEELDIEPDENETDRDAGWDAEEEAEAIRQRAGKIEGYASGVSYEELATVIRETDKPSGVMTNASVETLRLLSQTDLFEQLVSGDADRAARIASVLDRSELSLAGTDEEATEEKEKEDLDFDIRSFLS